MTMTNQVTNKKRNLASVTLLEADANYPTFPVLSDNPQVFAGDMRGARIGGFTFSAGTMSTITAMDATIQHSMDGVVWSTLKALTQITGSDQDKYDELDDTDPNPMPYLRVALTKTGTYGSLADVVVKVHFNQVGPKGAYAPPGFTHRDN